MMILSKAFESYPYQVRIKIPKFERNKKIRDLLIFLCNLNRIIGDFLIDPFFPNEEVNSVQISVGYGIADVPEDKMFMVSIEHIVQNYPMTPMEIIRGRFSKESSSFIFTYWKFDYLPFAPKIVDASKIWFFDSKELDWNKFAESLKMFCVKII